MRVIDQQVFRGERALFHARDLSIHHGLFEDGESPLKESRDIELYNTMFKWKYPLWYAHHIRLYDCSLFEMARAGIWYTDDIEMKNTVIEAPKALRRCDGVRLDRVQFSNAEETEFPMTWLMPHQQIRPEIANKMAITECLRVLSFLINKWWI